MSSATRPARRRRTTSKAATVEPPRLSRSCRGYAPSPGRLRLGLRACPGGGAGPAQRSDTHVGRPAGHGGGVGGRRRRRPGSRHRRPGAAAAAPGNDGDRPGGAHRRPRPRRQPLPRPWGRPRRGPLRRPLHRRRASRHRRARRRHAPRRSDRHQQQLARRPTDGAASALAGRPGPGSAGPPGRRGSRRPRIHPELVGPGPLGDRRGRPVAPRRQDRTVRRRPTQRRARGPRQGSGAAPSAELRCRPAGEASGYPRRHERAGRGVASDPRRLARAVRPLPAAGGGSTAHGSDRVPLPPAERGARGRSRDRGVVGGDAGAARGAALGGGRQAGRGRRLRGRLDARTVPGALGTGRRLLRPADDAGGRLHGHSPGAERPRMAGGDPRGRRRRHRLGARRIRGGGRGEAHPPSAVDESSTGLSRPPTTSSGSVGWERPSPPSTICTSRRPAWRRTGDGSARR